MGIVNYDNINRSFQQSWFIRFFWAIIIGLVTAVSYGFYAGGAPNLKCWTYWSFGRLDMKRVGCFEFFQLALIKAGIVALLGFIIIMLPVPDFNGKLRRYLSYR